MVTLNTGKQCYRKVPAPTHSGLVLSWFTFKSTRNFQPPCLTVNVMGLAGGRWLPRAPDSQTVMLCPSEAAGQAVYLNASICSQTPGLARAGLCDQIADRAC